MNDSVTEALNSLKSLSIVGIIELIFNDGSSVEQRLFSISYDSVEEMLGDLDHQRQRIKRHAESYVQQINQGKYLSVENSTGRNVYILSDLVRHKDHAQIVAR